jgi:hypothetical protein
VLPKFVSIVRVTGSEFQERTIALTLIAAAIAGIVLFVAATGGTEFTVLGHVVRMRTLYTPVMALTGVVGLRIASRYRLKLAPVDRLALARTARVVAIAAGTAMVLLSPQLYALALRIGDGRFVSPRIFWRSSPPGVDLLAFIIPNPNHPFAPDGLYDWLARPAFELEHVASIPMVAFAVMAIAWRVGWRPIRLWLALGAWFALLALGPFIHLAGVNTYVPGPWALLRYMPLVGLARTPARFAVIVMMAVAIHFTSALTTIRRRYGRFWAIAAGTAVLFEVLPVPRPLFSAEVPRLYQRIAADPRSDLAVLELPYGVSSGAFSVGGYSGRTQFYQTVHGKRIVGGALSRVSERRVEEIRRQPILDAFIDLSEGASIDQESVSALATAGSQFVQRAKLAYVVVDRRRATDELVSAAVATLNLELLGSDDNYELYVPLAAAERSRHHDAITE